MQSCAVYVGGGVTGEESFSQGGAMGILVALLFLLGGAFAIGLPFVSMVVFLVAGLAALVGWGTGFTDMAIWAVVSLILAGMSFLGLREKRRRRRRYRTG